MSLQSTEPIEFRTPWDDLDLDLIPTPCPIPRLKLSPPGFYLSLLPCRHDHEQWEEKWSNANTASDMRAITIECIEYERTILHKIATFKLRDSSCIAVFGNPLAQKQAPDNPVSEAAPSNVPTADKNHLSRKRARANKNGDNQPVPNSKRVKFKGNAEIELTPVDTFPGPLLAAENADTDTIPTPKDEILASDHSKPDLNPFNNPNPTANIVDLHQKIYKAVDAWYRLVAQAEGVENNLLATQSQSDVTISSLDQSVMSKEQLEGLLIQIQTLATQVMTELDEAALLVQNSIGFRSPPLAHFKADDPRKRITDSYELELEWQMKECGVFTWWLAHSSDALR